MSKNFRILVVTPDYPIEGDISFSFVKNLCDEFSRQGHKVTVVSSHSKISERRHNKIVRPFRRVDLIDGNEVVVYQPNRFSVPSSLYKLNNWLTRLCLRRFFKTTRIDADVCYCHFWRSAYAALPVIKKNRIPLFVATGEGELHKLTKVLHSPKYMEINKYLSGVVSVSTNNRNISHEIGLIRDKDCLVAPNAVNQNLYYKKNKSELRDKYGISQQDFIVAFVGAFNERKGPNRVSDAITQIGNVKSFFIGGSGETAMMEPTCEGILYKGRLPHEIVPDYLNMADIFVLPTLNEGCCNAIVEALACGLPVVSSNLPFNHDVLNETNSILINPTSINEIADAIQLLKENELLRNRLSRGALRSAEELTISSRAKKIINFIERHV